MEELLHPLDEPFEPLPEARQALLDRFKNYAVWHPRLVQVQTHVLDTIWEPADVVYVVVCGPSGVGKTVTLTLAVGLLKPDRGRIIVDGEDITRMSERQLAPVRRKLRRFVVFIDPAPS